MKKLEELDKWLEDGIDDVVTRREIAYNSALGITVFHCARLSDTFVGQHIEIEYKGEVYKCGSANQIKPTIKSLLEPKAK